MVRQLSRRQFLAMGAALAGLLVLGRLGRKEFFSALATYVPRARAPHDRQPSDPGNFRAIYADPALREQFARFLTNVYHLYPAQEFHALIQQIAEQQLSDDAVYRAVQAQLPQIKPWLGAVTYALPALQEQKRTMAEQTAQHLSEVRQIDGYLEVGSPGRYASALRSRFTLQGDIIILQPDAPSYTPTDIMERGQLAPIGRFVAMGEYAPIAATDIASDSLDLVANYIGFHHAPTEQLTAFVRSLHRVLKPGGTLIVRDHDVTDATMTHMVALAHDVFNAGLEHPWELNHDEIRHFRSLHALHTLLAEHGFEKRGGDLYQAGDPTRNALMRFVKV